jgi:hypothetical protein
MKGEAGKGLTIGNHLSGRSDAPYPGTPFAIPPPIGYRNGYRLPRVSGILTTKVDERRKPMHQTHVATEHRPSVLSRVIRPDRSDLSAEAARSILKLTFEQQDLDRMHDLAVRNQEGGLSRGEQEELADYRQAGLVLDLLKSKARLSLKKLGLSGE